MSESSILLLGVAAFTVILLVLVAIILFAKSKLVDSGDITISINDDPEKAITLPAGGKLLGALASKGIFVSSACDCDKPCDTLQEKLDAGDENAKAEYEQKFAKKDDDSQFYEVK